MKDYESCREGLVDLISEFKQLKESGINEATTRLKSIDKLLMSCLGWDLDNISVEESYNGDYADYILYLFRPLIVVEAKRSGNYFELPAGSKKLIQPLKSVYKDNENTKAAIDQVKRYCQDRSIPIGIVCNGWQIVAFVATRSDSIPVLEGNALVVDSLEKFLDNFKEVWNCLSKAGFEENHLINRLTENEGINLPQKLASTIYQYPGIKDRNPFQRSSHCS